jgi:hypothetical protein
MSDEILSWIEPARGKTISHFEKTRSGGLDRTVTIFFTDGTRLVIAAYTYEGEGAEVDATCYDVQGKEIKP